jgi:hypothetical protein
MVKRNKALRSPDRFLGADIGAAAAVGAKIRDYNVFSLSVFYDGFHGAFFDTDGATVAFFCIDYIGHSYHLGISWKFEARNPKFETNSKF